jgi:hypothetical protein
MSIIRCSLCSRTADSDIEDVEWVEIGEGQVMCEECSETAARDAYKLGHDRYEWLRTVSIKQFIDIFTLALGNHKFDDIVDRERNK